MKKKKKLLSFTVLFVYLFNILFIPPYIKVEAAAIDFNIEKIVNKTTVYPGEEFTYTIKYSNPNITTDATDVIIEDILPSNIKFISAIGSEHVQSIEQLNENGNDVVRFIFKNPLPAGSSGFVKIKAKFPEGITLEEIGGETNNAINTAKITSDNGNTLTSNQVIINPKLKSPDWTVEKTKVSPIVTPALGYEVTYEVKVTGNSLIGGLDLKDLIVEDTLPIGAEFISASNGGVYTPEVTTPEPQGGKVTWIISDLKAGEVARRYVTVKYTEEKFGLSSDVTNYVLAKAKLLNSDTEITRTADATHGFSTPIFSVANFKKSGRQSDDRYSVGQVAKFTLNNIENIGNVPLDKFIIQDDVPQEISLTEISTGSFSGEAKVTIKYKTNKREWSKWNDTPFSNPENKILQVSSLLLDRDEFITNIMWEIENGAKKLPVGFKNTASIKVNGTVSMPTFGNSITNQSKLTAFLEGKPDVVIPSSKIIHIIDPMPWMNLSKEVVGPSEVYMGDTVEFKIRISNSSLATGDLINPIAIDVLPEDFENPEYKKWNKGNSNITQEPIFEASGNKLKWTFNGTLKPGEYVDISFTAKIKDGTLAGSKTNTAYMTTNDQAIFENDSIELIMDTTDIDGDGKTDDKLIESKADVFVKFVGSLVSEKWIKGELDSEWHKYPDSGETLPGGRADYRLVVKNSGANGPISNIVIIDELPHIGDTGVLDSTDRLSEWRPYLVNKITGKDGGVIPGDGRIKIYYTTSENLSKEELHDPISNNGQPSDLWSQDLPEDITNVKAIKFDFGTMELQPDEEVVLEWPMRVPVGVPQNLIAWNSFGYGSTYPDVKGQEPFLPSEPIKVGFKVKEDDGTVYDLGNYVFEDKNKNGIQDIGEPGINGVLVNLYSHAGAEPIAYTRTGTTQQGQDGYYLFPKLSSGHYDVEFIFPKDYEVTLSNQGGDETTDSDISNVDYKDTSYDDNGIDKYKVKISDVVINSADNLDVDAGLYKLASIGDRVWNDKDADGIQDASEIGIEGVTVKLLDAAGIQAKYGNGHPVSDVITDANGRYIFTGLEPGTYKVQFINPNGHYKFSTAGKGSDDTKDSDTVNIETDASKATTNEIVIHSSENVTKIDAGMYLGQIGDLVWEDKDADGIKGSGENGINNVTVKLYAADGTTLIASKETSNGGQYIFDELIPGNYIVEFNMPSGFNKFTKYLQGSNISIDSDANITTGRTATISLDAGERDLNWDAGVYKFSKVGDLFWNDRDGDGVQDKGEPGIKDATVKLFDEGGNQAIDGEGNPVSDVTTDEKGEYLFTKLIPGTYTLEFIKPDDEYVISPKNNSGKNSKDSDIDTTTSQVTFTLQSGDDNRDYDAGIHKASIGNLVWEDKNANGVQDNGEEGIEDVTIELYDSLGNNLGETTTDTSGNFEFYDLNSGDYYLKFITPNNYFISDKNQGADDTADSDSEITTGITDIITLDKGERDLTWDAAMYRKASLGDFLWEDKNANGVQDSGEVGINGAEVKLYKNGETTPISSSTTGNNGSGQPGYYSFSYLTPGEYYLEFTLPSGFDKFTLANNTIDTIDSDANTITFKTEVTELISGEEDTSWDSGVYKYASIGDIVWEDLNYNGIKDSGESGFEGITVNLYEKVAGTWKHKSNKTTDENGNYSFDNLLPGEYYIEFIKVPGYTFTKKNQGIDSLDSDIDKNTGKTSSIILTSGEDNIDIDAGIYKLASVGDKVWIDADADGIQDISEMAMPNITVKLFDNNDNLIGTDITDISGNYKFINLEPEQYYVTVDIPLNYNITVSDKGLNDNEDNDFSKVTDVIAKTSTFSLSAGEDNVSVDAGIYRLSSIGDYVWLDNNGNGLQDGVEAPVSGVTVKLYDENDTLIDTKTTDLNGSYVFEKLHPGKYYLEFTKEGYEFTSQNTDSDEEKDSNANRAGKTELINLQTATDITSTDAGIYELASLGDYVWLDKNENGIQEDTEPGIEGITVNLLDGQGTLIDTTKTDSNGKYEFSNLLPGEYEIQFQPNKSYYKFTSQNIDSDDAKDSDANTSTGKTGGIALKSGETIQSIDSGFTVKTGIRVEKTVYADHNNGDGIGEELVIGESGTNITYLFKVTNIGDTHLKNIEINDLALEIDKSDMIKLSGEEILPPNASIVYYYETSINGDITNTAAVTGMPTDSEGNPISDVENPSHEDTAQVDEVAPQIDIQKTIKVGKYNEVSEETERASGKNGEWVTYIFMITNTGDTYLNNVEITDSTLGINKSEMTKVSGNEPLAPGQTLKYYYEMQINGDLTNTAEVTATPTDNVGTLLPNAKNPTDIDTAEAKALGNIGDYLWYDNNGNGAQDIDEPGIEGVTINLLDSEGNLISSTTTDHKGKYLFDRLVPGEYEVKIDLITLPQELIQTYELDGVKDGSLEVVLTPGYEVDTIDFGYYKLGKIGNLLWEDTNGNGVQDVEEEGIKDITVKLYELDGTLVKTTSTDENGYYKFENLEIGNYYVEFNKPDGYVFSKLGSITDTSLDSNADKDGKTSVITIEAGTNDMTWDAGIYIPASVGDYLWYDNNDDGIQDADESALQGVTIKLLGKDGNEVATTTTDSQGKYLFDHLIPGKYKISVDASTLPEDLTQTYELDSNLDGIVDVTLAMGEVLDAVDFGYYKLGKIGNYVWEDSNANGIQDADEKGIKDITVNLYSLDDTLVHTTITDEKGVYVFESLPIGNYYIRFVKPEESLFTTINSSEDDEVDSNSFEDGKTITISVEAGTDDMTWDAGIYTLATVGDYVWFDKNLNGLQDKGEVGKENIIVNLYKVTNFEEVLVDTIKTDLEGKYEFNNLKPGRYYIQVIKPNRYIFTKSDNIEDGSSQNEVLNMNLQEDASIDSDVNNDGKTGIFELKSRDEFENIDIGFVKVLDISGQIINYVDNKPIENAEISIIDSEGSVIDTTTTDEFGNYYFHNIPEGYDYKISVTKEGYFDYNIDLRVDSDEIPSQSEIKLIQDLPETGGMSLQFMILISIIMIALGYKLKNNGASRL